MLSNGTKATVSVFDIKHMILSLLNDESLMDDKNLAGGYDIFTGNVDATHPDNQKYGEIHTGDAWQPACKHYILNQVDMPVALIVFGDKSHTDLHGSLACTPIFFTLTLFNRTARGDPSFWRLLAYIPNLQHGKGRVFISHPSYFKLDQNNEV